LECGEASPLSFSFFYFLLSSAKSSAGKNEEKKTKAAMPRRTPKRLRKIEKKT